jgi:hypothetical protein
MRCLYFYGCRFGGACKTECGDARPVDPWEAQQALQERMNWEQKRRLHDSCRSMVSENTPHVYEKCDK